MVVSAIYHQFTQISGGCQQFTHRNLSTTNQLKKRPKITTHTQLND
ncbi:hypothetical protein PPIS_a3364 [Pseudoalteromonas piscicida]|uniref:Uncharacterized protein n=1 Tax=Pseudoalteromonas piscicida TaxID=43662 RepID=A0ABN5CHV4_PSEO7|nr:hypothetical protein PPIS_a3364 [Pseudoalteromonas piscicida]